MTSEQRNAIETMNFTDQSVSEGLQSIGASANASSPATTPNAPTLSQAAPGSNLGGMPADCYGIPMGEITGEIIAQSTPAASQPAASTEPFQVDMRLLIALLQLLEMRSQASG